MKTKNIIRSFIVIVGLIGFMEFNAGKILFLRDQIA